jgi:hypothetical protein
MPIKVTLQTIDGKKLKELVPTGALLNRLLPMGDARFPILRYVDPYSNTIFNGAQMYPLIEELDQLIKGAASDEDESILARLRELAVDCRNRPQTYLRFIGD